MRILPVACLLLLIGLHYSTCAERLTDRARAMLGKALVRRVRARAELAKAREESKTEEDKAKEMDMLEDIFVGSGSQSVDKTEASGSRREDVDNNDTTEVKEDENVNPSGEDDKGSGTGDDGGIDSDASGETSSSAAATVIDQQDSASGLAQGSETSTNSMDSTPTVTKNTVNEVEANEQQTVASSGSSQFSDESPAAPAATVSSTQDTSPAAAAQPAARKQPESAVSTPSIASVEDAAGPKNKEESTESTFKKSHIKSSAESDEDDSGSAEAIRKGIESLSRLLTPVASGYQFELYSGDAQKKTQNEPKEAEGESDSEEASGKGESDNADEVEPVKEKVCRRECHLPMTYQACAVPRCELKMGTIKDLCFWLCRHQREVCEQKCEYIERD